MEVDVQVQGHVATVSSTLLYVNEEERPLEAVFVFPLPAECALCHFSAKLGDVEVVAKLQDKQKVSTLSVCVPALCLHNMLTNISRLHGLCYF